MTAFPTRAEFAKWRSENPVLGVPNNPAACPLAYCLKERGMPYPIVTRRTWLQSGLLWNWSGPIKGLGGPLPKWAQRWVTAYDRGRELKP